MTPSAMTRYIAGVHVRYMYLIEKTFCRVKLENHKQCDTMGFWEDDTGKLEMISNTVSHHRTFHVILYY